MFDRRTSALPDSPHDRCEARRREPRIWKYWDSPSPSPPKPSHETRRALLYTWNPARYSNLTNNPKKYMQAYKKAEEMTKLIEAAHALLSAVLVPDEASDVNREPLDVNRKA